MSKYLKHLSIFFSQFFLHSSSANTSVCVCVCCWDSFLKFFFYSLCVHEFPLLSSSIRFFFYSFIVPSFGFSSFWICFFILNHDNWNRRWKSELVAMFPAYRLGTQITFSMIHEIRIVILCAIFKSWHVEFSNSHFTHSNIVNM